MLLFRFHRGGLSESMETAVPFYTKEDLLQILKKEWAWGADVQYWQLHDLEVKYYCYDERIAWHTYMVYVSGYGPAGFTNGPVEG